MRSPLRSLGLPACLLVALALTLVPGASAQDVEFDLAPGESYSHTFAGVGEAKYHCHPHPGMGWGNIQVAASEDAEPTTHTVRVTEDGTKQSTWGFEPRELTVRSGDTVTWVNEGKNRHTIMVWEPGATVEHDHEDGAHAHGDHANEAPSIVPLLPLLAALGVVALLRRR